LQAFPGLGLILLLPVLLLVWANDKILFWRRQRLIRETAPLLGGQPADYFPGKQGLLFAIKEDPSTLTLILLLLGLIPLLPVLLLVWPSTRFSSGAQQD
jgi:hypothetical protein